MFSPKSIDSYKNRKAAATVAPEKPAIIMNHKYFTDVELKVDSSLLNNVPAVKNRSKYLLPFSATV